MGKLGALLIAFAAFGAGAYARSSSGLPPCPAALTAKATLDRDARSYLVARSGCKKEWAVLVYMAADSDLAPYAFWDLHEMERVGSSFRADVVAQLDDTSALQGTRRYPILRADQSLDPTPAQLSVDFFREKRDSILRSPYFQLPENPSPRGKRDHGMALHDFLIWGMKQFPADRYMVILWGHGEGWARLQRERGPRVNRERGGMAFDSTNGTYLDIPTIRNVLRSVEQRMLDGQPIDVYASDACLMQMLEVAHELSGVARFISGSGQIQSLMGLPYADLLGEINGNAPDGRPFSRIRNVSQFKGVTDEGLLLAASLPLLVRDSFTETNGSQRNDLKASRSFTSSSFAMEPFRRLLIPAMRQFSQAMWNYLGEKSSHEQARDKADAIITEINETTAFDGNAMDVSVFLGHLETVVRELAESEKRAPVESERNLVTAIQSVQGALNQSVVTYAYGAEYEGPQHQFPFFHSKVISFWLPPGQRQFKERINDFLPSEFYRTTRWELWLNRLYGGR